MNLSIYLYQATAPGLGTPQNIEQKFEAVHSNKYREHYLRASLIVRPSVKSMRSPLESKTWKLEQLSTQEVKTWKLEQLRAHD